MTDTGAVSSIISGQDNHRKKKQLLEKLLKYAAQGASGVSGSIPAGNNSGANSSGSPTNNTANAINPIDSVNLSSAARSGTSGTPDNGSAGQSATGAPPAINSGADATGESGGQESPVSQAPSVTNAQLQQTRDRLQQMINSGNNALQAQSSVAELNTTDDTHNASQDSLNRLMQNGRNISDREAYQKAAEHQKWLADEVDKQMSGKSSDNINPYSQTNADGAPLETAPSDSAPEMSGGSAAGSGAGMGPGGPPGGAPPPPPGA